MASNFIIKLEIYPFDVMVSMDESDEVLIKRLKRFGNSREDCNELLDMKGRGRCVMLPHTNQIVIRLVTVPKWYEMADVIAHEVFHAVTFIMDRIGMKLELFCSDEAYAYLIGHITKEIYKVLVLKILKEEQI